MSEAQRAALARLKQRSPERSSQRSEVDVGTGPATVGTLPRNDDGGGRTDAPVVYLECGGLQQRQQQQQQHLQQQHDGPASPVARLDDAREGSSGPSITEHYDYEAEATAAGETVAAEGVGGGEGPMVGDGVTLVVTEEAEATAAGETVSAEGIGSGEGSGEGTMVGDGVTLAVTEGGNVDFEEAFDEHGNRYYINSWTGESTWEIPSTRTHDGANSELHPSDESATRPAWAAGWPC